MKDLNTEAELRALRNDLSARSIDYHVTNQIGGFSHDRALRKVYVNWKPLDQGLYTKLGFILIKWERSY